MKRAPWYVLTGAVAGFATVLGLHGNGAVPVALGKPKPAAGTRSTTRHSRPAGTTGGRHAGAASGGAPAAPAGIHSATGPLEQYGYGELAVRVTVDGNQVTAVSVPLLRTAEPYSQQLAQQVIPMLRSEVITAHSARINGVSGATYTSEAYAASLQAALDKLHVR
jgi:uncharacterized protein with FMN-binding domain